MSSTTVQPFARLRWDEAGQPISTRYDDVYFSRQNGLEESRYVFLRQNALSERWQSGFREETFYIGETGFGTGLNFLAAWQLWERTVPPGKHLHFISLENEPLERADLEQALALWPELASHAQQLLKEYPQRPAPGFHPLSFAAGRVKLTLIVADATAGLNELLMSEHPLHCKPFHRGMDAWFLDGFAPARNPAMWQPGLFDVIAALSREGTSLATFTAAGLVRRQLQRVGFRVEKRPGYGRKRHMITATCRDRMDPATEDFPLTWRNSPHPVPWHVASRGQKSGDAVVIGAGLAGSHSARALAERGWTVTVLDQAPEIASGASGNDQGIVYGKLSSDTDGLARFNLASLLFAQRFYRPYWRAEANMGAQCGVLQLASGDREQRVRARLEEQFAGAEDFLQFVEAREASEIAGIAIDSPGLYFPRLGWLRPALLCGQLLDHPHITVKLDAPVATLEYSDGGMWQLLDRNRHVLAGASKVVIANAHGALQFPSTAHLPLKPIRGQVSVFRQERVPLKTVVCGDGYIAPASHDGNGPLQSFGATFTLHEQRPEVLPSDHWENLATLKSSVPSLAPVVAETDPETLEGRTGFRCTTADYLPLVGPAPDFHAFVDSFRLLARNARSGIPHPGNYHPGLYINVGHGSRGLAYTPLAAELLAAEMSGDPLPVPRTLATALNPARFIVRDLIRHRLQP